MVLFFPREVCFCYTDLHLLTSHIALRYSQRVFVQEEGCLRELKHSPNYSPARIGLGRALSLMIARLLEYSRLD